METNSNYTILKTFFQISILTLGLLAGPAIAQDPRSAPEIATGTFQNQSVTGARFMVVAAHPEATRAGYEILGRGGSAADAVVAVQLVLGLVEPQSSGIGGGGFALYFDAATRELMTLDGRETAPINAGKHLFTGPDGKPMRFYDAAIGGRSVGTPGMVKLLWEIHQQYGKLPWRDVIYPAIRLAEDGFTVTPRLSTMLRVERRRFQKDTDAKLYFYPDTRTPLQVGQNRINPHYASVLRRIALEGPDAFYQGELAEAMVKKVHEARYNPGLLSLEDLAGYQVKIRRPVCGSYRSYKICSMGEPSSGGLTLLQILAMLEGQDLPAMNEYDPKAWHLIGEASRLAFADRNYYMADPDVVKTPGRVLLDRAYVTKRAALIRQDATIENVQPGNPPWSQDLAPDTSVDKPGTTHISIVDAYGNIVSMTSSIETAFGSHMMVEGFLLNNQLTDFSFVPEKDGLPVANRVQGGKRPRSSMTPVIAFDPQGRPFLAIGSAGGSRIIGYVLQRIIALIDWNADIQTALNMPHVLNRGEKMEIEEGLSYLGPSFELYGHRVETGEMTSGLTAIHFHDGVMTGAADNRREGIAMGE